MAKANVEQIKDESNYLRGTLAEDLEGSSPEFSGGNKQLLKFHGIYEQEDRDSRKERKKQNLDPITFFMIRSRLPGGKMTPEQWLAHDELADRLANGTIRLTSRQAIQFHGVFKGGLRPLMRGLDAVRVTTLAACGDVQRNVMCCPAPIRRDPVRDEMQRLADMLSVEFLPKTRAYHEVWLNGTKTNLSGEDHEPIYGKHYLPRKFKTAVGLPEDNCVDLLANDLGFLAIHREGRVEGYDVHAGGGMGMTHGNDKTYPRLATPVCFVTPDEALDVAKAVVMVQRDFGNREDRKNARLKYTIDRMGRDAFAAKVAEYAGRTLAAPSGTPITGVEDHLGWHEQGDGKWWLGLHVLAGRLKDTDGAPMRSGIRDIVWRFGVNVRITATQNLLLCDVNPSDRTAIATAVRRAGFIEADALNLLARNAMACVATPTCGLALADSERVLADVVSAVHREMASLGLGDEDVVLHTTGCPNGCARPFNAEIGLVGRSPGKYVVYLGGDRLGTSLAFNYADHVPTDAVPAKLRAPLLYYKQARRDAEGFGDFCRRVGKAGLIEFAGNMA